MTIAISQSYFFPYIGYFQLINSVDKFILYDWLSYIKKGWIDRNRIAVSATDQKYIKIYVEKRSPNKRIKDLAICYRHPWQEKIIRQLKYSYARFPHFRELYPFFVHLLQTNHQQLSEFNREAITAIAGLLDIQTSIIGVGDEYPDLENELKTKQWPYDIKTQRILSICRLENADTYINAIGGQKLYSKKEFQEQGIQLFFIKTHESVNDAKETSGLSIIDVLFRYGVDETKGILNRFELL